MFHSMHKCVYGQSKSSQLKVFIPSYFLSYMTRNGRIKLLYMIENVTRDNILQATSKGTSKVLLICHCFIEKKKPVKQTLVSRSTSQNEILLQFM